MDVQSTYMCVQCVCCMCSKSIETEAVLNQSRNEQ